MFETFWVGSVYIFRLEKELVTFHLLIFEIVHQLLEAESEFMFTVLFKRLVNCPHYLRLFTFHLHLKFMHLQRTTFSNVLLIIIIIVFLRVLLTELHNVIICYLWHVGLNVLPLTFIISSDRALAGFIAELLKDSRWIVYVVLAGIIKHVGLVPCGSLHCVETPRLLLFDFFDRVVDAGKTVTSLIIVEFAEDSLALQVLLQR